MQCFNDNLKFPKKKQNMGVVRNTKMTSNNKKNPHFLNLKEKNAQYDTALFFGDLKTLKRQLLYTLHMHAVLTQDTCLAILKHMHARLSTETEWYDFLLLLYSFFKMLIIFYSRYFEIFRNWYKFT